MIPSTFKVTRTPNTVDGRPCEIVTWYHPSQFYISYLIFEEEKANEDCLFVQPCLSGGLFKKFPEVLDTKISQEVWEEFSRRIEIDSQQFNMEREQNQSDAEDKFIKRCREVLHAVLSEGVTNG